MDKHIDLARQRRYYAGYGYGADVGAAEKGKAEAGGQVYGPEDEPGDAGRAIQGDDDADEDGADIIGMAEQAYALGKSYEEHYQNL